MIVMYGYFVIDNKMLKNILGKLLDYEISKYEGKSSKSSDSELIMLSIVTIGIVLTVQSATILYLILSYKYDIYVYPSLVIYSLFIYQIINSLVSSAKNNRKNSEEKYKMNLIQQERLKKKFPFVKANLIRLIYITYFIYIGYSIIFIK